MDLQKASAYANVATVPIGCIGLYFMWASLHQHVGDSGAATQSMTSLPLTMWVFLATLIVAGLLHVSAAVIQRRPVHIPTTPVPATPLRPIPNPAPASSQASHQVGRDFVGASITPEYLIGFFREHTYIQGTKLIKPFIGKWIRVSGKLNEVISSSPDHAQVTFSGRGIGSDLASVYMYFRNEDAIERLAILRRGDDLTIIGEINEVNGVQVNLSNCEVES
jgi:hypothetical protein